MKVISIIGARPQFIKHFPFELEARKHFELITIHTGQHYDDNMSKVFFDQLGMDRPHYLLSLGGGFHGEQTGKMLIEIERIVQKESPDAIVVFGDTNSTLAGALVGAKLHIPVMHIEAGLRSYNRQMPEEVNRVMTDHVSELLFIPSESSRANLAKEGITEGIHCVGDIMKDALKKGLEADLIKQNAPVKNPYWYVTLHRPYNVDDKKRLIYIFDALSKVDSQIILPIHPRTRNKILEFGIDLEQYRNIKIIEPQSYFENLNLLAQSIGLITDSGGMQKEAYWLKKQCITIRKETEWTETLQDGANVLIFDDLEELEKETRPKKIEFNEELYGDGTSAQLICKLILKDQK